MDTHVLEIKTHLTGFGASWAGSGLAAVANNVRGCGRVGAYDARPEGDGRRATVALHDAINNRKWPG